MFGYKNDLRRPSVVVATTVDESPNGADTPYYSNESLGGSGLSINKVPTSSETIDLIVIGDETSNKTRFISCFLNNGIGEDPQLLDISCRKSVSIQSGTFNVNMHTTAGQEEFWGVNDSSFRSGHGFIFVYNVNNKESFNQFQRLREKIVYDKNTENIIMAMIGYVGNTDQYSNSGYGSGGADSDHEVGVAREVQFSEAKRMADLHSCSFTEFLNFDRESEGLINATIHDLVARIMNSYNTRGRSNSVSRADSNGSSGSHADHSINRMDLLLVGDIFTGKTQYIQRLIGNDFSHSYKETPTEFTPSLLQTNYKDCRYFLKLLDSRGLELESNLSREKIINIPGFIFIYSITSKISFQHLENLKRQILSAKGETKVPCILIGTKHDSLERQVSVEEGQRLATSWSCPHFEISSLNHDDDIVIKPIHQLLGEIQKSNNTMDIGEFKKKGFLMKEGKKLKSMSKYFFKIHKGNLLFSKNEFTNQHFIKNNTKIKVVELSEQIQVQIINSDVKKDIWPFQIIDPIKQYYMNLLAPSEAERDAWVTTLKLNCYANEMIGILVDDVVKGIVTEIAESLSQQIKRSDSKNNLLSYSSNSTPNHSSTPTPQSPSPLFSSANGQHHNSNNDSDYSSSNSTSSPMLSGESGSPFKKSNLLTRTSSFKGKTVFK